MKMNYDQIEAEQKQIKILQQEYLYTMTNRSNYICSKLSDDNTDSNYKQCIAKVMSSSLLGLQALNNYFDKKYPY
jgi:hypothetical protein